MKNSILLFLFFSLAASTLTAQNNLTYQPAADTITNTESDTLTFTFPANAYDYCWNLEITTGISGTDSLSIVIQETASPSSTTSWKAVGNTDVLGASSSGNRVAWETGTLYGLRQRIIITGIGTQSTRYRVWANFKRRA